MALSIRSRILYCFPTLLVAAVNSFVGAHLIKHYIDDLALLSTADIAIISSILGSAELLTDILRGHIVDNWQLPANISLNKNAVLIGVSALIVAVSNWALFNAPASLISTRYQLAGWFVVFSLLKKIAPLDLCYAALGSELTDVASKERDELFATKHVFDTIGNAAGAFVFPFAKLIAPNISHGTYTALLSMLFIAAFWGMLYSLIHSSDVSRRLLAGSGSAVAKKDDNASTQRQSVVPLIPSIKRSFSNRAFLALLALYCFEAFRGLFWAGLFPFYMTHVLGFKGADYDWWMGILNIAGLAAATLSTPFWIRYANKHGKYHTWLFVYALQVPIGLCVYLFVGRGNYILYLLSYIAGNATGGGAGFLTDSIRATVMDYEELRSSGIRRDATFVTSWGVFPKYISLPGSALSFSILSMCGYQSAPSAEQPEAVIHAVNILAVLLPSLTSLVCLYIMSRFPITDNVHKAVLSGITQHKRGEKARDPITNQWISPRSAEVDSESQLSSENAANTKEQKEYIIDHFFNFELQAITREPANRTKLVSRIAVREQLLACGWGVVSTIALFFFITNTIAYHINDSTAQTAPSELHAVLCLWLSSISCNAALFHYLRIKPATQLLHAIGSSGTLNDAILRTNALKDD